MRDIAKSIIVKAAGGDMPAFEEIYREYSSSVYTIAAGITRNREDAEEVTQDVFVKIFRALKGFRFNSSFGTWIYRVATNAALNVYNSRARRISNTVNIEDIADYAGSDRPVQATEIEQKEAVSRISRILEGLSPEHRSCIVLREIEGLGYQEIAEVLRIPINTVRSRLKRARESMALALKEEGRCHEL